MSELLPSTLETNDYGSDLWNNVYSTNFEKLNDGVGCLLNDLAGKTADVQIKGSGNDSGNTALDVKNSDGDLALRVRNDRKIGIGGVESPTESLDIAGSVNIETSLKIGTIKVIGAQGSAIADATEDIASIKTQLNLVLAMLRTHGLIASS